MRSLGMILAGVLLALVFLAFLLGFAGRSPLMAAEAPFSITVEEGRLSIRAENAPLSEVLKGISRQTGVTIHNRSQMEGERINIVFRNIKIEEGFEKILDQYNIAFIFSGRKTEGQHSDPRLADPRLAEVWIFSKKEQPVSRKGETPVVPGTALPPVSTGEPGEGGGFEDNRIDLPNRFTSKDGKTEKIEEDE
ncbi:MAG: hypothetical protein WAO55_16340 [Candidatus Manganitrophaceae bacterium]